MSLPKQPRQIMINLMYIVLTALLAMNVSAEILNAFHVINLGIENSNAAVATKNDQTMHEFSDQLSAHQEETQPYYDKATEARKIVSNFIVKIDAYKTQIIQQSGGWIDSKNQRHYKIDDPEIGNWSPEKGRLMDDKDLDVTTRIMVQGKGGDEVMNQIELTRSSLLSLVDENSRAAFEEQLPLHVDAPEKNQEGEIKSWPQSNFDMMPTIASLTLLNKFQNDARNSESQILDYLFDRIYKAKKKVDAMQARVISPANYIITGTPYKADILVAAYNSSENPEIIIGPLNGNAVKDQQGTFYEMSKINPVNHGTPIQVLDGIGKFLATPSKAGTQSYSGAVVMKGTDGQPEYYPFEASYMAADAAAVVSSDNLNVIYAAIANPFSISVPGFAAENVSATISDGSLTRTSPGKYEVNVPVSISGKQVQIAVSAKMPDGFTKPITQLSYKVKTVPPPIATVYGKSEGKIKRNEILVAGKVAATLKDFYFSNVNYEVISFRCIYAPRNSGAVIAQDNGKVFGDELLNYMNKCRSGDRFIFENIYAKGPGGVKYPLNSISLTIE